MIYLLTHQYHYKTPTATSKISKYSYTNILTPIWIFNIYRHSRVLGCMGSWNWSCGLDQKHSPWSRKGWSDIQRGYHCALDAMEGLICHPVGVEHVRGTVPSLQIIILRSPLYQLCYPILNIPIQASPEFHYD